MSKEKYNGETSLAILIQKIRAALNSRVSTSTTINGKPLTSNITLTVEDIEGVDSFVPQGTTITIDTSDWSSLTCTKSVTGVTASNNIIVSPAPSSVPIYAQAGIYCSAQANGQLTFKCSITPTSAVTVNVFIYNTI